MKFVDAICISSPRDDSDLDLTVRFKPKGAPVPAPRDPHDSGGNVTDLSMTFASGGLVSQKGDGRGAMPDIGLTSRNEFGNSDNLGVSFADANFVSMDGSGFHRPS